MSLNEDTRASMREGCRSLSANMVGAAEYERVCSELASVTEQLATTKREVQVLVTAGITATERAERAEAALPTFAQTELLAARIGTLQEQIAALTQERKRLAHAIDPMSESDRLERSVESLEQVLVDERGAQAAGAAALREALSHLEELAEAWRRGCISEHDGLGGARSNRNWDVLCEVRAALAAPVTGAKP